ncbi:related to RER2-cis-prenyltransferase [Serendipita indica DSM 11827]|uniref:Alkyl transferase n=1 Tax=Serendipita indica (strain DSM 11827) TaxID=1109443 RepID=G4TVH3_SERID|nr:related to RER2-cis-prenyltransferase [Serendipita indica DSM 11827]
MDGNRRFARNKNEPVAKGHDQGSQALRNVLEICMRLGVPCVSVYAFSIENFKRPKSEVDTLMSLIKRSLLEISQHGDLLERYSVRVAGIGKTEMLPPDVLEVLRGVEEMTRHHKKALLNICMPYTSQDEIATAVQTTVQRCVNRELQPDQITQDDIDEALLTSIPGSPPLDILVRTSGVRRLSNYFLWQTCADTQVHFLETLWPSFGLWDLTPILMDYQKKQWTRERMSKRT